MNTITCPHCNKTIEISEALSVQAEEKITARLHEEHKKALEAAKQKATDEADKRLKEQFQLQLKQAEEKAVAEEERSKKLLEQVSQLMEEIRTARREKDEAKIEMQKQLVKEEEKIRFDAQKKAEEEQHLKIIEKDKQLQDALKANEEMRRKLQQGSQQTQGEAFEEEFENSLAHQYPNDKVSPVGKGVKGGDIIQEVWDREGNYCGKILWELKNTKTWSEGWVDKLKVDKRSINAEEAVLISEVIPNNMKVAGYRNGIWVTQRAFVISLADTLRAKLIQLYYVKNSVKLKDARMEILYSYLSGTEFKNRVEAIVEAFTGMQAEVEKEKRYFSNKWARDEKYIRQVIDNTFGMHGDFKAIVGAMIPQIRGLEEPAQLESGDKQTSILEN